MTLQCLLVLLHRDECHLPSNRSSKLEFERLTDIGVLMPVDEPTDWVSNLVVATKESGDLRLCLDPQQLNKALKR